MKPRPYKPGDKVRIVNSRFIRRVGYPLHYKELACEARDLIESTAVWETLGLRNYNPEMVYAVAKLLVEARGFGGNERTIHYFETVPKPDSERLWALDISEDDRYAVPMKRHDDTGCIATVISTLVRQTGTRVAGGGYQCDGGWEWENGYLDNRKTHVILNTDFGLIEACDVELVEATKETRDDQK